MDPLETNSVKEFIRETSSSNVLSTDLETDDCGDPPIPPRIGDEYQVTLPPMKEMFRSSNFRQKPNHEYETDLADGSFGVGLAIPVRWVPVHKEDTENRNKGFQGSRDGVCKAESASLRNREMSLNLNDSSGSKSAGTSFDNRSSSPKARFKNEDLDGEFYDGKKICKGTPLRQRMKSRRWTPLPDRTCISWSDSEVNIFLLGLYIFGKNLSLVRRFMDAKGIGGILSFYYGKFYQSDAYKRWSECRKSKSKKYIQGQRIFTGWRQQELLSRLLPTIPEENRNALLEATQSFNEGTILFEEYVFKLMAMVGLQTLVEAIAIGKGKRDLTGIALDPTKTVAVPSSRPDIPVGKACSSLTSAEIISFLTGNFRLSKARSNDLFWEAVWPRLLARGWHSEQPKNRRCPNARQTLVFLVPGVSKFSRRKLQKGNHYYDSVTDVLNKVASDPKLLELDAEGSIGVSKENAFVVDLKVDQNGLIDQKYNSGPCADTPNSTSDLMKFTIVDTSLVQGEAPYKITDLRTLPMDNSCKYSNFTQNHDFSSSDETDTSSKSSSDDQQDHVGMSLDGHEAVRRPIDCAENRTGIMLGKVKVQSDHSDHIPTQSKKRQARKQASETRPHSLMHELPAKGIYSEASHKSKPGKPVYLSPVSKRRRLTACKHPVVSGRIHSSSRVHQINKDATYESFNASDYVISVEPVQPPCKASTSSSCKDSLNGSSDNTFSFSRLDNHTDNKTASSDDKSQPRVLIDLNVPPDIDVNETYSGEVSDSQHDVNINGNISSDTTQPAVDPRVLERSNFEQPNTSSRRQSTRNRPLTTRVLESLESGFFSMRRRAPSSKGLPTSKSSRRQRKIYEAPQPLHTGNPDDVSNNVVDARAEDMDNDSLRSFSADPSLVSTSQIVLEDGGLTCNFLDRPQTIDPENLIRDHIS